MERKAFQLLSDMERSWWYRGRARVVKEALRRTSAPLFSDLLDFGAGYGGMYGALSEIAEHVYAFEPDSEASAAARRRGYAAVAASESEAFARRYDAFGLFDVLEHIRDDGEFLIRAQGALRENGRIMINVPAFPFLWSQHDVDHHHFRRYTRRSMRSVLESAGFTVEYMSYWNMILFIPAVTMRLLGGAGDGALAMPRLLDSALYGIVRIESCLIRFFALPFGTSLVVIARKESPRKSPEK